MFTVLLPVSELPDDEGKVFLIIGLTDNDLEDAREGPIRTLMDVSFEDIPTLAEGETCVGTYIVVGCCEGHMMEWIMVEPSEHDHATEPAMTAIRSADPGLN